VTLEYEKTEWQVNELLAALDQFAMPVIFTMPNADTNSRTIIRMVKEFVESHPLAQSVDNLGTEGYFSLMALATAMVGNSSSGIIEAPSFRLPVVNIGTRQRGRLRAANVIDVGYARADILAGVERAVQPEFKERIRDMINPYGCAQAADKILSRLKDVVLNDELLMKCFSDIPG
jgi:UDP-hydrolysing UDP-N-acetyl-D-glucosamine 2-epimerase